MSDERAMTIAVDFDTGINLASYPGILSQVKVGELFHVGQKPYRVRETRVKEGKVMFVFVQREPPNETTATRAK